MIEQVDAFFCKLGSKGIDPWIEGERGRITGRAGAISL
jgi:hypothetical protein